MLRRASSAGRIALFVFASACGANEESTSTARGTNASEQGLTPCSPIEGAPLATSISGLVAAGRHPDGTFYAIDSAVPEYRAFVSSASVLQRRKVVGSGRGADFVVASIDDPIAPFTLKVESEGGQPVRMTVLREVLEDKDFNTTEQGDALELVNPDALAQFDVRDISESIRVELDAQTEDAHLVVLRQDTDERWEHVRVFYGTRARMTERRVQSASSSSVTFVVDGVPHDATFSTSMSSVTVGKQIVNGETQWFSSAARYGTPSAGLVFYCF